MSNIRLLSLDLDGTLLNSQKRISDENLESLLAAKAKGVKVVLNTGRPVISTLEYLSNLNLFGENEYSITYNGGLVQRNDGEILSKTVLTHKELARIVGVTEQADFPCDIISGDICYTVEFGRKSMLCFINDQLKYHSVKFDEIPLEKEFNKIIISAQSVELDELYQTFDENFIKSFELCRTRDVLLEIMPKGVSKGAGLKQLCDILEIKADEVLAMGDEDNDASMLEWAGLGIAPANSKNKARQVADEISDFTNDENAVAEAVKHYVL